MLRSGFLNLVLHSYLLPSKNIFNGMQHSGKSDYFI